LYEGIEILFIGKVVEKHPMKYFRMIAEGPSSLHQDFSYGIPTYICLDFEDILKVW
jgi:hypothetical protein